MRQSGTSVGSVKLNMQRKPWWNPRLHRKVVNAALSGARAIAAYKDGILSTVCSTCVLND
jgi:hypothetical protein